MRWQHVTCWRLRKRIHNRTPQASTGDAAAVSAHERAFLNNTMGCSAIFLILLIDLGLPGLRGQGRFEVASVKRHIPSGRRGSVDSIGRPTSPDFPKTVIDPQMIRISATTAERLIAFAFGLRSSAEMEGNKPDWLARDAYDVIAKSNSPVDTRQMKTMLQALLEDRFKLQYHRERREEPVYVLLPGKKVKLTPAADDEITDFNSLPVHTRSGDEIIFSYVEKKISVAQIADWLSDRFRQPVIDKTGIQGLFSFTLKVTDDQAMEKLEFIHEIQEQLGLKIESQRAPFERLIIDRIEPPSDN